MVTATNMMTIEATTERNEGYITWTAVNFHDRTTGQKQQHAVNQCHKTTPLP